MENIAGDKMFAHVERALNDRRPITADIFLTNYCNNKCPYCTYRRWELETGAYSMRYEEFVEYAERLLELGVEGFILTGGGEPTLCRDFKKITDWLEAHSIHYGINTNFNEVQYIKPDYLKVSLDGWDEDSYEKSRGVRAYEKVRNNIQAYADWKRRENPETTLGIQKVVKWPNDVYAFYTANCDLDVDYIVFRPIEVLPDEPIDAASMLINATITVEPSKSGTFSPLHDKEPQTFAKYDINQLQEIAEHLLTYCNAQERGCKDACGKNCEP